MLPRRIPSFRRTLLAFFDTRARDLPWRGTGDPYAILVSEVMLQQTRVETVKPYFRRWMERFPTIEVLAAAPEAEVLKLWEGLGYYSRARNLHSAVREISATYGGRVPDEPSALRELPGIGPYTAGAVASIAFGRAAPAVDGNARRVLARLCDLPAPSPAELDRIGSTLVDPDRPGAFNQALMELGSLVCTPRAPSCDACPVEGWCAARKAGTVPDRPLPKTKRAVPRSAEVVVALVRGRGDRARVLVRRRPDRGLLAGMWELPGKEVAQGPKERGVAHAPARRVRVLAAKFARELARDVATRDGASAETPVPLPRLEHAFSHRRVTYHPYLVALAGVRDGAPRVPSTRPKDLRWIDRRGAGALAFPKAQQRILASVWEAFDARPLSA